MDALAESYASELISFGIDTTILVPGAFTSGTNHFAHAGKPADTEVEEAYDAEYGQLRSEIDKRLADLEPEGANVQAPESRKKLQDAVTDAFAAVYGEHARPNTLVILEEVHDNGWSLGGTILNESVLGRR